MHVSMFRDDPLSPEEVEALDQAVAAELHRLEEERKALAPPAPPPQEKSWHERWGLTPPEDPDSTGPVVERPRRAR
ncbi:MAG: hypothetical protein KatS3mg102_0037 [Planctomycetota bacterium]|nr:MAG: hypothetical protein KatS3mg102_0037 [Planctomycetota bacterium]